MLSLTILSVPLQSLGPCEGGPAFREEFGVKEHGGLFLSQILSSYILIGLDAANTSD